MDCGGCAAAACFVSHNESRASNSASCERMPSLAATFVRPGTELATIPQKSTNRAEHRRSTPMSRLDVHFANSLFAAWVSPRMDSCSARAMSLATTTAMLPWLPAGRDARADGIAAASYGKFARGRAQTPALGAATTSRVSTTMYATTTVVACRLPVAKGGGMVLLTTRSRLSSQSGGNFLVATLNTLQHATTKSPVCCVCVCVVLLACCRRCCWRVVVACCCCAALSSCMESEGKHIY